MGIEKLFVERGLADAEAVRSIRDRLKLPLNTVNDPREVYDHVAAAADPVRRGKEVLFLTRNRGAFVRDCPGTRHYTCCGYRILHVGSYCSMDCAYCILQAYYHPPVLQYFINHDDMDAELDRLFAQNGVCRIGTGEFTDSLIWESWTDLSRRLIPRFARQNQAVLELKSKTTAIEQLERLDHRRKTILAWSLNTPQVIHSEERSTASLGARLKAAAHCEALGYPLAFHFDPMVIYDGCEAHYRDTVRRLFESVNADNVVWISMGTFRFVPALKTFIQGRFPQSRIVYGEFISGLDGKMRYFKPLRIALYRRMAEWIRQYAPRTTLYLCMEDEEVWRKAMGIVPSEHGGLSSMLDASAVRHCGLVGSEKQP